MPEPKRKGPALHAGVAPPGPAERHPLAGAQPSRAEGRADHAPRRHHQVDDRAIRDRTHWNSPNLQPMDPVTLGLCSQIDLDLEVQRAAKEKPVDPAAEGPTLLPASETTIRPRDPRAGGEEAERGGQRRGGVRQAQADRRQGRVARSAISICPLRLPMLRRPCCLAGAGRALLSLGLPEPGERSAERRPTSSAPLRRRGARLARRQACAVCANKACKDAPAFRRSTAALGLPSSAPGRAFAGTFPGRQRAPRSRLVVAWRAEPRSPPECNIDLLFSNNRL